MYLHYIIIRNYVTFNVNLRLFDMHVHLHNLKNLPLTCNLYQFSAIHTYCKIFFVQSTCGKFTIQSNYIEQIIMYDKFQQTLRVNIEFVLFFEFSAFIPQTTK